MEYRDADRCEITAVHVETVERVRVRMPRDEALTDLADLFKMFADSTRVKILYALHAAEAAWDEGGQASGARRGELCVCDISALLSMTSSAVSHQLRALRQTRLVKYRRDGKIIYYSLDDEHVSSIFQQGFEHAMERG
ncbi:MAG: metalloregulator ArsR/SmtB family transcription factor [Oscillospiraceae bacterium]|jgi:DNA-binding transcriptional ArsR family regulator|nr:metalloregulator ArsR/SmtB family transcription factor [Oscillospiraceae bacterium]